MNEVVRSQKTCWPCLERGKGIVKPYRVVDGVPMCYQCIYDAHGGIAEPPPPARPPLQPRRPRLPVAPPKPPPVRPEAPRMRVVGAEARTWEYMHEMHRQWWRKHKKEAMR